MSASKEFDLTIIEGRGIERLKFHRHILDYRFDPEDLDSIGLNISFHQDLDNCDEDEQRYDIFYFEHVPPGMEIKPKKRITDNIDIAHLINDTNDIRNLAKWLNEQADEIDEELQIANKYKLEEI
ncbi:MAG: hypothetical protein J7L15_02635 [Clostridiales bacterium]|nr:hypothetical protein [Clostridiales bacterium]